MTDENAPTDDALPARHAAAVVEQAAAIASMGLPLSSGLRAAAADAPSPGLGRALRGLAGQIDQGRSLDEILSASRVPKRLAGILRAGQRSGQFGAVFTEWIENRRAAAEHWRSLQMALAYPLITFVMTVGVYLMFLAFVVRPFRALYEDFGLVLPAWTKMVLAVSGMAVEATAIMLCGGILILLALRAVGGSAAWSWLMSGLPLVGKAWHFAGVAEMLRGLAILIDNRLPLPEALRLTADGISDDYVGTQCRRLAKRVDGGTPLWSALMESRTLPLSIVPLVRWGEMHDTLGEALRTAAEMLEGRLRLRSGVLMIVLPPVTFIIVGLMVSSLAALFLPMISLIQGLS